LFVLLADDVATALQRGGLIVDLPEEIRNALARNAAQLMPITVDWSSHVICVLTVEEVAKELKRDTHFADYVINTRRRYRLSWQDGKYFSCYEEEPCESKYQSDVAMSSVHESSFDGERFFGSSVYGSEKPRRVIRDTLAVRAARNAEARYGNGHYFEEVGFIMPSRVIDLQQHAPVRSKVLQALEEGGELIHVDEVEFQGRKLVRLRIISDNPVRRRAEKVDLEKARIELNHTVESEESKDGIIEGIKFQRQLPEKCVDEFYLDPQLNYAMRRSEWKYEQIEGARIVDCEDFQSVVGRPFHLPTKCIESGGSWTTVHEVTQICVDPLPEERLSLKDICSTPGTVIHENSGDRDRKTYVVEPDGTLRELRDGEQP
jgi:hypothetical protein